MAPTSTLLPTSVTDAPKQNEPVARKEARLASSIRIGTTREVAIGKLRKGLILNAGHIFNATPDSYEPSDCKIQVAGLYEISKGKVLRAWEIQNDKLVERSPDNLRVMDECGL